MNGMDDGTGKYAAGKNDKQTVHKLEKLPMTHKGFIYFKARTQRNKKAKKSNKKKGK